MDEEINYNLVPKEATVTTESSTTETVLTKAEPSTADSSIRTLTPKVAEDTEAFPSMNAQASIDYTAQAGVLRSNPLDLKRVLFLLGIGYLIFKK